MNRDELTFVMFLIYQLAEAWDKKPAEVYMVLKQSDILDGYIVPCYDCLHTLGKEYLIDDISELAVERGMTL